MDYAIMYMYSSPVETHGIQYHLNSVYDINNNIAMYSSWQEHGLEAQEKISSKIHIQYMA